MSRPLRVEFPGALYHVMSRGVASISTFEDDADRIKFLGCLRELIQLGQLIVFAFVLMLNHFHLLCETPEGRLSHHMQWLLEKYTCHFNRRYERSGHLWRARYKAILVENGDYLFHCSRYIHLNPVKTRICAMPQDYRWSSYRRYLGLTDDFDWVDTSRIMNCFANGAEYEKFVLQGLQKPLRDPFSSAIGGLVFGTRGYAEGLLPLLKMPTFRGDVTGMRELAHFESPTNWQISTAVMRTFDGASASQLRRVLIYALRRFTQATGREIAQQTGVTPSAVTKIWQAFQRKSLSDVAFRHQIDGLDRMFKTQGNRT